MSDEDQDSKTEQPTSRRLEKAREEGSVLQSQEVKTIIMLIAMLTVVWLGSPFVINRLRNYLAGILDHMHEIRLGTTQELVRLGADVIMHMGIALVVPFVIMIAFGLLASIGQTGFLFLPNKLMPDFNKINPMTGLKRLFSAHSVLELGKNVIKLTAVGAGCFFLFRPKMKELELLMGMEPFSIVVFLHGLLIKLIMAVIMMMVVVAAVDWFYQRFAFMKKMRMTRQEVKDEHKDVEGDPMIKSRIRSLRVARARQRMMAAVPKADVVITNPTHFACALKYDMDAMGAPVLVAKGQDFIALKIREIATENEVPIVENPPLARALFASVEIDQEIPPEHYKAVAEVISYVLRLKEKYRGRVQ